MKLFIALALLLPTATLAKPVVYALQPEASSVGFETDFGPDLITGQMPVASADLHLDFDRVGNSSVNVALDVSQAKASFPFAAQALRGPKVLDAQSHPQITFRSTRVRSSGNGALIDGQMTIRGITHPATLQAVIWRQEGAAKADLSHLVIRLTGAVMRSAYGATGWSDMVGDEVRITILASIAAAG